MDRPLLRGYQIETFEEIARTVEDLRNVDITMMFPRQSGKNEISAAFVAFLLRLHSRGGGRIIVTAPTLHPQATISRDRTFDLMRRTRLYIPGRIAPEFRADSISIRCGSAEATFLSASPTANVAGHTASIALIADEAQDIDREWFDRQFRPMTASTGAPTVLFGTPWTGESLLERAAAKNRALDAANVGKDGWRRRHYQVGWEAVAQIVKAYGPHVEAQRERLGATSAIFRSQYELEASERAGRLFSVSTLASITGGHGVLDGPVAGERYVGGLDFGGETEHADATVLTIGRVTGEGGVEVVAWQHWQGAEASTLTRELPLEAARWRLARLHADATGMGQPLVSILTKPLGRALHGVTFSANSKSEMGWLMRTAAETGRLRLPADNGSVSWSLAMEEYAACMGELREGQRMGWGAPQGKHDDFVASLALCLDAAEQVGAARVAVGRGR